VKASTHHLGCTLGVAVLYDFYPRDMPWQLEALIFLVIASFAYVRWILLKGRELKES